ncbi:MAG: HAMP domain-containing protein [Candidatus Aminicenantes bacterium]|nr:HAMP domain-containing protein [Candidatus Aminicenantes bacterium]
MKRAIFLKIFGGCVLLILLIGALSLAFSFTLIRSHYERAEARSLESLGQALLPDVETHLDAGDAEGLDAYVKRMGPRLGARLTVIAPDGEVLADSEKDPATMENHRYRPEVQDAVEGRVGRSERFSYTVEARMLYVGLPLVQEGRVRAVVRQSLYLSYIEELLADLKTGILRAVLVMALLALTASALFSLHLTSPIRLLTQAARRVADGNFATRVHFRRRDEFRLLGEKFNEMTERLEGLFNDVIKKKEELANVIGAIREGLAVFDGDGRLRLANSSFAVFTGGEPAEGRYYWEIVRSAGFQDLIARTRAERKGRTAEFRVGEKPVLGTTSFLDLQDGVVAVLHDLSEIRRIEHMKRDFVVNVSHELRTPLAVLSGAIESLEDGAADHATVDILRRHTERLKAIVEDLLKLAEFEDRGLPPVRASVDVREIAEGVLEMFRPRFLAKGLSLRLEAPDDGLVVKADPYRIEQMLINLVDNALKYTEGGAVAVKLGREGGQTVLEVVDTGIGIVPAEMSRIFERFYVVDKSRSRRAGGTGLGLSIVKHIVEGHGGTVEVRSVPGEGTAFTVRLPSSPDG